MQINYITNRKIPSMEANSVNSVKMCNSFANHGFSVNLYCDLALNNPRLINSKYAIKNNIKYRKSNIFSKTSFKLLNFFLRIVSDLVMSRKQNRANDDFVYSRNLFSLLLLSKTRFAYELHKPPKHN